MTNEEYISKYKEENVRSLALKKVPEGVDAPWCLTQIEGYQLAKRKLPRWAETEGVWFPPRISMEQCSSESTAKYKAEIAAQFSAPDSRFIDITGGFGVDFSYMAPLFGRSVYVEQQEVLCDAARHNFPMLGLQGVEVVNAVFDEAQLEGHYSLIYADPARRDDVGRKVYAIEDCTPDITMMQDCMLSHADYVMLKLSPMLDLTQALRSLRNVTDVHVVSVKGECKELLFVMSSKVPSGGPTYHCVNLEAGDAAFVWKKDEEKMEKGLLLQNVSEITSAWLYEPNASIMKAGLQDAFAMRYGLTKLHPMSNVYISQSKGEASSALVPARAFRVVDVYDFSKQSLKRLSHDVKNANITIRNFPSTVEALRKRLKIKEGGSEYIFATTLMNGSHVLIRCEKVQKISCDP